MPRTGLKKVFGDLSSMYMLDQSTPLFLREKRDQSLPLWN